MSKKEVGKKEWDAPEYPFETAILYDSFQNPVKCAHAVPLDNMVRRLYERKSSPTCPCCQRSVAFIVDGCVEKKNYQTVTFKHGKQIYRLSVPPSPEWQRMVQHRELQSWWEKPVRFALSFLPNAAAPLEFTAQARIAQVLGLDLQQGTKILSKGKIVFPSTNLPDEVSRQLLDDDDDNKTTPKWLVMGTPTAQIAKLQKSDKQHQETTSFAQTAVNLLSHSLRWLLTIFWSVGTGVCRWLLGNPVDGSADSRDNVRSSG